MSPERTESTEDPDRTEDVEISERQPQRSVIFVCWGNICRSPIAERVAERRAADAGLDGVVFTSAATSTEELGEPMDRGPPMCCVGTGIAPRTMSHIRSSRRNWPMRIW